MGKGSFFEWEPDYQEHTLFISDSGLRMSYKEARQAGQEIAKAMRPRALLFLLCSNSPGFVLAYLGAIRSGVVPLLLEQGISRESYERLARIYQPDYAAFPEKSDYGNGKICYQGYGYRICQYGRTEPLAMHPELSLLLCTSGSTGSPKLVRQSYQNIQSNAQAIAEYLEIGKGDRPITTLPMNYTYGLSILHSHVLKGATLLLTDASVTEARFWGFFKQENATSFGGVPATYGILKRLGFFEMHLPSLKVMTQAGGKLSQELQKEFCSYAKEKNGRFIIMYGQTEATARMSYLPWERAEEKLGSIGVPIPGGAFCLLGGNGKVIEESGRSGELIYSGENVAMGYAECRKDLGKGKEWGKTLHTGDLAYRDQDGFYYITGRKKRFLKIFGKRVSLDEAESLLREHAPDMEFACTGQDDKLKIFYVSETDKGQEILPYLEETLHLNWRAFELCRLDRLPRNAAGKIQYGKLGPGSVVP